MSKKLERKNTKSFKMNKVKFEFRLKFILAG